LNVLFYEPKYCTDIQLSYYYYYCHYYYYYYWITELFSNCPCTHREVICVSGAIT